MLLSLAIRIKKGGLVIFVVILAAVLSFWQPQVGGAGKRAGSEDLTVFTLPPGGEPQLSQAVPDFGPDGLKGLSEKQKDKLFSGEVVLVSSHEKEPEGKTIISAALVFEVSVEQAWTILSATELQAEYLEEIEELEMVEKGPDFNRMFFLVKEMGHKVRYTVIHHFVPDQFYLWWELDRSQPCDLKELYGFWKLFRYDDRRTVARYGSYIKPVFPVPAFIRYRLSRGKVRSSLEIVKKYVEGRRANLVALKWLLPRQSG